jgi:hypothetical protein
MTDIRLRFPMIKIFSISLFSFILQIQFVLGATSPEHCGLYELRGSVEKNNIGPGYLYLVNKGTMSEFKFVIPSKFELQIAPYVDRPTMLRAKFSKKIEGLRGEFSTIESIVLAVNDPLGMSAKNTLLLITKEVCAK